MMTDICFSFAAFHAVHLILLANTCVIGYRPADTFHSPGNPSSPGYTTPPLMSPVTTPMAPVKKNPYMRRRPHDGYDRRSLLSTLDIVVNASRHLGWD